ncbi:MAG: leucine--tRNA ligase [Candidatus Woesearchaeota archaeon]|nr:MAG: leucine--tRNA ligase [Candidatus Woesearchaeota archaeon]
MIDFKKIERKWQKRWEEKKVFSVSEKAKKPKFYNLEMFPYPSGSGLHMGHALNYTIGDIYARFKRMIGFNVLYPMGYDSFGLPAENAAIKEKVHPKKYTENAIKNFIEQQKELGLSYDWDRVVITSDPEYYKWNQYFFLKFYEKGLVYRKKAAVNWCPNCDTVLANEQVHNGKCWRHEDIDVEIKQLEQWFIRTTKYADELLNDINKLQWPEKIKIMQDNWIGKSEGTLINFQIKGTKDYATTFTTRADTSYGVTFIVYAPEHPKVIDLVKGTKYEKSVKEFINKVVIKEKFERTSGKIEKEGMFIGRYAINPVTNEEVPIYIANFVLPDYGTGCIDAVPAHDQRDFEFAKKYNLPIKTVIEPVARDEFTIVVHDDDNSTIANEIRKLAVNKGQVTPDEKSYNLKKDSKKIISKYFTDKKVLEQSDNFIIKYPHIKNIIEVTEAYLGEGKLINSGQFDGINNRKAISEITRFLEKKGAGKYTIIFKLRDWLVSRQRYWGTPIPVIYCDKCGIVTVPESELPVLLPEKVKFGEGNPLATNKEFVSTKCHKCKGDARRETDTLDTFFDSSWYYLRYCDNKNNGRPFDLSNIEHWMPVDQYIGGAEHACMHLIYARFFTKALRDLGFLKFNEPFLKLFNQGMLHGEDGYVMAKSRGNVVLPEEVSDKYGIDTARLFLVSVASPDKDIKWDAHGIEGSFRFVNNIFDYFGNVKIGKTSRKIESKLNKTIKNVTDDVDNFRYNSAVIKIRALFESFEEQISKNNLESFLKLLHPFCPHITEELWEKLGNKSFISLEEWPKYDEKKIDPEVDYAEELVETTLNDVRNLLKLVKVKEPRKLIIFVADNWKYHVVRVVKDEVQKTRDIKFIMSKVMLKEAKDIGKLVPGLVKNPNKIPSMVLDQDKEVKILKDAQGLFEKEFKLKVEIMKNHDKALPGRPTLLIE